MNIQTVQFTHILESRDLEALDDFLSRTAFVISHKNEGIETILKVLWYIPVSSTIIIVTNCPEKECSALVHALKTRLADHRKTYLIHQKDKGIARLFKTSGVSHILGTDGKVIDGKGEGMYIGALCAHLLGYLQWIIFYDADNFVPSALLEYTLAMCRLFTSAPQPVTCQIYDPYVVRKKTDSLATPDLHNVRICWASKPDKDNRNWDARILGRTTRVVSPLFESLLNGWFGIHDQPISSSNAGEQGMTVKTATSLRFSSGFSVETFLLLDLLFHAAEWKGRSESITFQQYLSQSPHFHEKKGNEHIKTMIEQSLGCFFRFEAALPADVKEQLQQVYDEFQLERVDPFVYPPLQTLPLKRFRSLMERYALFMKADYKGPLIGERSTQEHLAINVCSQDLRSVDASTQEHLAVNINAQDILRADTNYQDSLITD